MAATMSPASTSSTTPHSQPFSHSRQQRTTPIARAPTSLSVASAGQLLSPTSGNNPKTPSDRLTRDARRQSPSYFGLSIDPSAQDGYGSNEGQNLRQNWSPPTSNVRSAAAASPLVIPLDQNPEFEAFRRQAEQRNGFSFATQPFGSMSGSGSDRSSSDGARGSTTGSRHMPAALSREHSSASAKAAADEKNQAPHQRSPKRLLSSPVAIVSDRPRRNSPASFNDRDENLAQQVANFVNDDRNGNKSVPPPSNDRSKDLRNHRAETVPEKLEVDGVSIVTPQHIVGLLETANEDILFLDLRVSTQYARSSITGALNLCIPTTLLKRPSFNVEKLAETFKDPQQREKFERWRSSRYIVVFDANTVQMKDAATCVNTLKKFASEGFNGVGYIIRGGFAEFSAKFPSLVMHRDGASDSPTSSDSDRPAVAPVVGGCPMPATKSAANPFFGNIRQNMDLIGGVGQLALKYPNRMTQDMATDLPTWLREAAEPQDGGKLVADKFLAIEKKEQKRMQDALSGTVHYGTPGGLRSPKTPLSPSGIRHKPSGGKVQIAGVEKGNKNRYNNIWPFEHSRVKLQGVPDGGCDYVNANHVKASGSRRRYIATQGPIPATFSDFWNMVWQQDVRVIVMLTAEQEGGQIKAHNYWSSKKYNNLVLKYLSEHRASLEPERIHRHYSKDSGDRRREKDRPQTQRRVTMGNPSAVKESQAPVAASGAQPYVIVRKFTLSRSDMPFERMREITQLQYSNWPDFGAPAHPAHLLGLVEQCDAVRRSTQTPGAGSVERPIVVHCSAGCGRTGTFCTVDSVIDMMKQQQNKKEEKLQEERSSRKRRSAREPTPMDVDSDASTRMSVDQKGGFFPAADSSVAGGAKAGEDWLLREDVDLIDKTVEEFRLQRLSMVQSLRQFVLCYESVLEWLAGQLPRTV